MRESTSALADAIRRIVTERGGEAPTNDVTTALRDAGFTWNNNTILKARQAADVEARRRGFGKDGGWWWKLKPHLQVDETQGTSMAENADLSEQQRPKRRRGPGRPFPKGVSGNPGGRPKVVADVRAALEGGAVHAARTLVSLIDAEDPKVAIAAAKDVIDRVLGKPRNADDDQQRSTLAAFFAGVMSRMGAAQQQAVEDAAEDGDDDDDT